MTKKFGLPPCTCGAEEGQPHNHPCEYEECPWCHEQIMFCGCAEDLRDLEKKDLIPHGQEVKNQKYYETHYGK